MQTYSNKVLDYNNDKSILKLGNMYTINNDFYVELTLLNDEILKKIKSQNKNIKIENAISEIESNILKESKTEKAYMRTLEK